MAMKPRTRALPGAARLLSAESQAARAAMGKTARLAEEMELALMKIYYPTLLRHHVNPHN